MSTVCRKTGLVKTHRGDVYLEGPVDAAILKQLYMNDELNNFRPPNRQKNSLIAITKTQLGMIYTARNGREIAGYLTFHRPDGCSRWSRHPSVLEMGGIEVSPDWRNQGIALGLLEKAYGNPIVEQHIVLTMEFCWHWDLKRSGLGLFEYQKMLSNLFGKVGLRKRATDDPDIIEHPANVLMVRIGKYVASEDVALFEKMLFEDSK